MEFRDLKKQYQVLKPQIDSAIEEVCTNAQFIGGSKVKELEEKLAEYVGVKHCITCANGTDALQLALMAWGIGPGDAVFVPDFTYFSSAEVIAAVGAVPVFVDVCSDTYNLDPEDLEKKIQEEQKKKPYHLRAVISVDLFGLPADYGKIRPICDKYGLHLLEDGAQGFGGRIGGKRACSFGDIGTTSFFPAKPLGCYGDGGAVFTDNDEWADLIRSFAVHGKGQDKYDNVRIGMNSRLDSIQAAILSVKLQAFSEYELDDVNRIAEKYSDAFQDANICIPQIPDGFLSSWAQYTIQLPEGCDREALQKELKVKGIPTMVYYPRPMHGQKAFGNLASSEACCPVTQRLCNTVLSLPIDPYKDDQSIQSITQFFIESLGK